MKVSLHWPVLAFLVGAGIGLPNASGTEVSTPIDQKALEGDWVSVNWEHGEVIRLHMRKGYAVMAVSRGTQQPEFVFRSEKVTVENGKVAFVAIDPITRLSIRVEGEGWIIGEYGGMGLRLSNANPGATFWKDTEGFFLKGPIGKRLEELVRLDKRTRALVDGRAKPCCM